MYYCPNCMSEVKPGTSFCTQCGTKLDNVIEDVEENEYYEEYYEETPIYRGMSRDERVETLEKIDAGYGIYSLSIKGILLLVAAFISIYAFYTIERFNSGAYLHSGTKQAPSGMFVFFAIIFFIWLVIYFTGYCICELWYFSKFKREMGYKICPFYMYLIIIPLAGAPVVGILLVLRPFFDMISMLVPLVLYIVFLFLVTYFLCKLRTGISSLALHVALFVSTVVAFLPIAIYGFIIMAIIAVGLLYIAIKTDDSNYRDDYMYDGSTFTDTVEAGFLGSYLISEYFFPWKRAHRAYGELKRKIAIYKQNNAEA